MFVRHAEKVSDGSKDPALTAEGVARAERLAQMLSAQKIDAVYSTNFVRTRATVEPLAKINRLDITTYESFDAPQLAELASRYKGGTIVICGHSNTTPAMINKLVGSDQVKQYNDGDY